MIVIDLIVPSMKHDWHAGDRCIGPDRFGIVRRGRILMRQGNDLTVEWDDRTISEFGGEDVEKLAREESPASDVT